MISRRFFRGSVAFVLAAAGWLAPTAARAASCSQTSDCPKGFACQIVGVGGCATPACAPDQPCPATTPVCDAQMITECAPLPCATSDDCATGMVCFAQTSASCPGSALEPNCAPGAKCSVVDPGPCTTTTTNSCVPKYDVPCHVDSDCGSGFTCVPDVVSSCSGGGVSSSAGGGVVAPTPTTCTSMTLSTSRCSADVVNCAADGDCPSGWTCVEEPQAVSNIACAEPVRAEDGGGAPIPVCDPGPTPAPQKQCAPPYSEFSGGGVLRNGSVTSGTGESAPMSAGGSPGASSIASTGGSGGCQVGSGAGSGEGAGWLALFGLVGLVRRRR